MISLKRPASFRRCSIAPSTTWREISFTFLSRSFETMLVEREQRPIESSNVFLVESFGRSNLKTDLFSSSIPIT